MSVKKSIAAMLRETAVKLEAAKDGDNQLELAAQAALENGTTIATPADEMVAGVDVFVVPNEGDPFPLETGTYTLDNGATLVVEEEGVVAKIATTTDSSGEGEGGNGDANEQKDEKLDAAKIKSIVETQIKEHKFASEEKITELNGVMEAQTQLLTKLSEEVQKLSEPIEQRADKKKTRKRPEKKDTSKMTATERATYLREMYQS